MARILCVEDSREFQIYLGSILREHRLTHVSTVRDAIQALNAGLNVFDLIILDVSLPDGNALKALPEIREIIKGRSIPLIIVSSDTDVLTKVAAFSVGADDYITKPPNGSELKARIEAKLRWASANTQESGTISYHDVDLDPERMAAERHLDNGSREVIDLTPFEFKILRLLLVRPGQVFSREQIIDRVWGVGRFVTPRTIDAHVSHLRNKLQTTTVRLETIPGAGYRVATP